MSVQTLYTAATGMQSMQTRLDVVANNLANVNTVAFKKGRANFEDLFYRHEKLPGAKNADSNPTATGISIGLGSRVSSIQTDFSQGAFEQTGDPLDIAIVGEGFFQVADANAGTLYTRAGNLSINADGNLVVGSAHNGRLLEPNISIPDDAVGISISPDGRVSVQLPNNPTPSEVGQMQLVRFPNPEGLLKLGDNLYSATEASNTPTPGTPQGAGFGEIRQNTLEASNVEPVNELIDLITTQRSFELNSQAVQAGDQVLQLIANLRRG